MFWQYYHVVAQRKGRGRQATRTSPAFAFLWLLHFLKIPQFLPLLSRLSSSHLFIMRIENMFIKAMRIYAHMDIYIYLYVYMYIDENI